jgi:hypothetical protein
VLQLIRRGGATGKLIGELLAAKDRTSATIPDTSTLALQDRAAREETQDGATCENSIAEWIFSEHLQGGTPLKKEQLISKLASQGRRFSTVEFDRAYREVYASENHRSPRQGWPLKEPFLSRLKKSDEKSIKSNYTR